MSGQIQVDELDFDKIKNNLRLFLSSQNTLKDYNYEGSALSILLDVLAYNTHYNSLYTNFVANEMFLDSASKYSSAVSLAKTIGYTPTSFRSASSTISLVVTLPDTETPNTHTIPKGTTFSTPYGEYDEFLFSTSTDYTAVRTGGKYTFPEIKLYEGTRQTRTYTSVDGIQFVIPHKNVDTTSLTVEVRENGSSSVSTAFKYAQELISVGGTDPVFFIKQREDLYYEVYFGNGIIGTAVVPGNVVKLNYLSSSGTTPNGSSKFTYFGGHRADINYVVTGTTTASGGAVAETLQSIKFNAPKAYVAQNRAVTVSDYESTIYNNFPNIQSVKIWGGQDHIPKTYGKVFICAKPYDRELLNTEEQYNLLNLLNSRKVMTMIPTLVNPEFLRIEVSTSVYYNSAISKKTPGEMQTAVRNAIVAYGDGLNVFDSSFRHSVLTSRIDSSDKSITSNITNIRIRQPISAKFSSKYNYYSTNGNPIHRITNGGTVTSTRFYEAASTNICFLRDDGTGVVMLMEMLSGTTTTSKIRNVGTVDYINGKITVIDLNVTGLYDAEFEFLFQPGSYDVVPTRQYILTIPAGNIEIDMISDKSAVGSDGSNSNHIFTYSR